MVAPNTVMAFRFVGGDADEHQLNFYDASRFLYGASRFIYTLEHFRQSGRVLNRITERVNVDYRIPTPQPGSWLLEIMAVAAPAIGDLAIKVPMDVLVAWAKEKLLPSSDTALKTVQLVKEIEAEHTAQSREETKRVEAVTDTVNRALALADKALDQGRGREDYLIEQLRQNQAELASSQTRLAIIEDHRHELAKIDEDQEAKILSRVHSQMTEMGKPLTRSAVGLEFIGGADVGRIAFMNRQSIESLSGNQEDPLPTLLHGDIIRFDKNTGWGKFKTGAFAKDMPFLVPSVSKNQLRDRLLDAMKRDGVEMSFYCVRNRRKVVEYLVLDRINPRQEQ